MRSLEYKRGLFLVVFGSIVDKLLFIALNFTLTTLQETSDSTAQPRIGWIVPENQTNLHPEQKSKPPCTLNTAKLGNLTDTSAAVSQTIGVHT